MLLRQLPYGTITGYSESPQWKIRSKKVRSESMIPASCLASIRLSQYASLSALAHSGSVLLCVL